MKKNLFFNKEKLTKYNKTNKNSQEQYTYNI